MSKMKTTKHDRDIWRDLLSSDDFAPEGHWRKNTLKLLDDIDTLQTLTARAAHVLDGICAVGYDEDEHGEYANIRDDLFTATGRTPPKPTCDEGAAETGFTPVGLDKHGELEIKIDIDGKSASIFLSRGFWKAVTEKYFPRTDGHSKHRALYFGCTTGGHFLQSDGRERDTLDPKETYPGFPWEMRHLDSTLLKNGEIKDNPDGRVYWTCGGRPDLWFAFFWWDRSGDKRPASNSGLYVRGFEFGEEEDAFIYACAKWPKVVKRQAFPLRLVKRGPAHGVLS